MSIYTQQATNIMERLSIADQQFALEFLKKMSRYDKLSDTNETMSEKRNPQEAINKFFEAIDNAEPLLDDELDEILTKGITLRTPEDLDLL